MPFRRKQFLAILRLSRIGTVWLEDHAEGSMRRELTRKKSACFTLTLEYATLYMLFMFLFSSNSGKMHFLLRFLLSAVVSYQYVQAATPPTLFFLSGLISRRRLYGDSPIPHLYNRSHNGVIISYSYR